MREHCCSFITFYKQYSVYGVCAPVTDNLTMNHVLIIIEYLISVLDIKQLRFTSIIDAGDKYFFSHMQDMYYFNELESCPCSL